jgi:hypothetical protein
LEDNVKGTVLAGVAVAAVLAISAVFVISHKTASPAASAPEKKAEHASAHGGCLNAMGTCENGHAEVKVEGDAMKLWFVNGGSDTLKAVHVPDAEIALSVTLDGEKDAKPLMLKSVPNALAEEKVGDSSHFEGTADWLANATTFVATGSVTFKGTKQEIRIEYPEGYDPD